MALTGLHIYKLLPKTNCKECGFPTCLAFAMQLANKQVALDKCPYVTAESKAALDSASEPPIKLVTIGVGDAQKKIGQETVLFRHEEKFHNPCGIAIKVKDTLSQDDIKKKVAIINGFKFERVGQQIAVDMIAVENSSGDAGKFASAVETVDMNSALPLILISNNTGALKSALDKCADKKPLVYCATADNYQELVSVVKEKACPLAVCAADLESLADLTAKIKALGHNELVIDPGSRQMAETLRNLTKIRRYSLKKGERKLGYPVIAFTTDSDPEQEVAEASIYIAKYAGIVVIEACEPWQILPLLTVRQNIYTDPQKPIQVESKVYTVGEVNDKSPVLVTTNFSITYFTVEGDVESAKVPAYIVAVDTEGTSVMTAWAAEKFNAEIIAKTIKDLNVENLVSHRKIVVPGGVAVLSGKLEEELAGWKVMVGPRESAGISSWFKTFWTAA